MRFTRSLRLLAASLSTLQLVQCDYQASHLLDQLNSTLRGKLQKAEPLAAPCFRGIHTTECSTLRGILASGKPDYFRSGRYQGFQYIQSEACLSEPENQCLLSDSSLLPANDTLCRQGSVSPHYVEITGARDVQAIFKYARQSKTALAIKNGGHDYVMRNSQEGSLAMWTRSLTERIYHMSFSPLGCADGIPMQAIELGAGVSMNEAFEFAHAHDVLFVGGTVATIGASGGWLLNGGHGVLTGTHGLAVDRVLQFEIVTPDGVVRTANRCTNPDLFWALRGGGGGAFGVVLSSTHMVSIDRPITGAVITFPATADNQRTYVDTLVENMPRWRLQGWTGPSYLNATFISTPLLNVSEAKASLGPAIEYAKAQNGTAVFHRYSSFFEYYSSTINGTLAPPQPIVQGVFMTSRVITEDVFTRSDSRERLVDAIFQALETLGVPPSLMITPPYLYGRTHPAETRGTSVHPAWYDAPLMVLATSAFRPHSSLNERKAVVAALRNTTEMFKRVAPDGCAYANEADPWLDDWGNQIWGKKNYERLLQVKKKFDPLGLLHCWHCVGWSRDIPGYRCISGVSPHGA
ncbi:hypothetical protein ANO14919_120470 [Xylariales sp. No.14919]|nr:hypothetical protein ANO14919_120470 [Xylariales sp. No.14919]